MHTNRPPIGTCGVHHCKLSDSATKVQKVLRVPLSETQPGVPNLAVQPCWEHGQSFRLCYCSLHVRVPRLLQPTKWRAILECQNCLPGGEFISVGEIKKSLSKWNGMPLTIDHPRNGKGDLEFANRDASASSCFTNLSNSRRTRAASFTRSTTPASGM